MVNQAEGIKMWEKLCDQYPYTAESGTDDIVSDSSSMKTLSP